MNKVQQEQLFTELTSAQAETITAAADLPIKSVSVFASYGKATALFKSVFNMFEMKTLYVKDTRADGHPVYAMFQGQTSDGSSILTARPKWFDRKGAAAREGTFYNHLPDGINTIFAFTQSISKMRLVIMRDNPGRDLFVAGSWVDV
ncbi:MAG TPA: hypothetical protein V6C57_15575 [Coleofasciculaceae cyanobacterium]